MARFRLSVLLSLLAFFAFMPAVTFAAGFFGPILPQSGSCNCGALPMDWGCVLQVLQNLIQFAVSIGVILCVLWIAYAGFTLMVSGGSPEARSQGKTRIMNAIVGILVILSAWLLVDFVMKTLYNPQTTLDGGVFGPWNSILADNGGNYCIQVHTPVAITAGSLLSNLQTVAPGTSSGPSGVGGSCAVMSDGPCSPSSLSAFGSAASQASQICDHESGGNPTLASGSDKMRNDPEHRSFSFGLFQINLTQNPIGSLNCPAAFNGTNYSATVRDERLYAQCVGAAENASANIQEAVILHARSGWNPWLNSEHACGLALERMKDLAVRITGLVQSRL